MVQLITRYFNKKYLPRWIVLLFDISVVILSLFLAYILRFNFNLTSVVSSLGVLQLVKVFVIYLICFRLIKPYSGILRLSTTKDVTRIIAAIGLAGAVLSLIAFLSRIINIKFIVTIPYSVIIIHSTIVSLVLITSRLFVKFAYTAWFPPIREGKKVMIFGAGKLGQITRNALILDDTQKISVVGFIDDNISLQNKSISGIPVYSSDVAFEKVIQKKQVTELILAIDKNKLSLKRKREIIDLCLPKNLLVKEIPTVNKWLNGGLNANEIKKINIEDLLGRDSIKLDRKKIIEGLKDATILITGAAGSIGSEIVRQVMAFNVFHAVLLDKSESDLYNLQNEILTKYKNADFTVIVGDVTNKVKLRKIFEKHSPSIVINAAAYKHVPLMEEFPCEAIRVNIGGTRILANLSVEFGVKKFVLVSTDKAVNPTNVMGASKRISEMYIQSLAQKNANDTQFITTRFGNVLGSNGSVVPLFKKQIENGGPVTVTHHEITRFFMTIPEACQLVLEACFMGKGGEIFVFDMGEPVKIYDLAEKMIFLSGFIPHRDIKIEVTKLRPGEKLFEEVLNDKENTLPTYNDKIMIGKVMKHDYKTVNKQIVKLLGCVDVCENQVLIDCMREITPEFKSQNSHYENNKIQFATRVSSL